MLVAAVLVAISAVASAQTPELRRRSLKGVGETSVVISLDADAVSKEKLREEDRNSLVILNRVERKLRRGGMAANPQIFQDPRPTVLEIKLSVQCSGAAPVCAVGINVRVHQDAQLDKSGTRTIAATWYDEQTTAVPHDKMADAFAGLDGILDRLVIEWQTANKQAVATETSQLVKEGRICTMPANIPYALGSLALYEGRRYRCAEVFGENMKPAGAGWVIVESGPVSAPGGLRR